MSDLGPKILLASSTPQDSSADLPPEIREMMAARKEEETKSTWDALKKTDWGTVVDNIKKWTIPSKAEDLGKAAVQGGAGMAGGIATRAIVDPMAVVAGTAAGLVGLAHEPIHRIYDLIKYGDTEQVDPSAAIMGLGAWNTGWEEFQKVPGVEKQRPQDTMDLFMNAFYGLAAGAMESGKKTQQVLDAASAGRAAQVDKQGQVLPLTPETPLLQKDYIPEERSGLEQFLHKAPILAKDIQFLMSAGGALGGAALGTVGALANIHNGPKEAAEAFLWGRFVQHPYYRFLGALPIWQRSLLFPVGETAFEAAKRKFSGEELMTPQEAIGTAMSSGAAFLPGKLGGVSVKESFKSAYGSELAGARDVLQAGREFASGKAAAATAEAKMAAAQAFSESWRTARDWFTGSVTNFHREFRGLVEKIEMVPDGIMFKLKNVDRSVILTPTGQIAVFSEGQATGPAEAVGRMRHWVLPDGQSQFALDMRIGRWDYRAQRHELVHILRILNTTPKEYAKTLRDNLEAAVPHARYWLDVKTAEAQKINPELGGRAINFTPEFVRELAGKVEAGAKLNETETLALMALDEGLTTVLESKWNTNGTNVPPLIERASNFARSLYSVAADTAIPEAPSPLARGITAGKQGETIADVYPEIFAPGSKEKIRPLNIGEGEGWAEPLKIVGEKLGVTDDMREGLYITPDGMILANRYTPPPRGVRKSSPIELHHHQVARLGLGRPGAMDRGVPGVLDESQSKDIRDFVEQTGAVRVRMMRGELGVESSTPLTEAQIDTISKWHDTYSAKTGKPLTVVVENPETNVTVFSSNPEEVLRSLRNVPAGMAQQAEGIDRSFYGGRESIRPIAPPTASVMWRTIESNKFPENIKPEQLVPTLKKYGVKDEELKWGKIHELVYNKTKAGEKISRAELNEWVRNHDVQFYWRTLGSSTDYQKIAKRIKDEGLDQASKDIFESLKEQYGARMAAQMMEDVAPGSLRLFTTPVVPPEYTTPGAKTAASLGSNTNIFANQELAQAFGGEVGVGDTMPQARPLKGGLPEGMTPDPKLEAKLQRYADLAGRAVSFSTRSPVNRTQYGGSMGGYQGINMPNFDNYFEHLMYREHPKNVDWRYWTNPEIAIKEFKEDWPEIPWESRPDFGFEEVKRGSVPSYTENRPVSNPQDWYKFAVPVDTRGQKLRATDVSTVIIPNKPLYDFLTSNSESNNLLGQMFFVKTKDGNVYIGGIGGAAQRFYNLMNDRAHYGDNRGNVGLIGWWRGFWPKNPKTGQIEEHNVDEVQGDVGQHVETFGGYASREMMPKFGTVPAEVKKERARFSGFTLNTSAVAELKKWAKENWTYTIPGQTAPVKSEYGQAISDLKSRLSTMYSNAAGDAQLQNRWSNEWDMMNRISNLFEYYSYSRDLGQGPQARQMGTVPPDVAQLGISLKDAFKYLNGGVVSLAGKTFNGDWLTGVLVNLPPPPEAPNWVRQQETEMVGVKHPGRDDWAIGPVPLDQEASIDTKVKWALKYEALEKGSQRKQTIMEPETPLITGTVRPKKPYIIKPSRMIAEGIAVPEMEISESWREQIWKEALRAAAEAGAKRFTWASPMVHYRRTGSENFAWVGVSNAPMYPFEYNVIDQAPVNGRILLAENGRIAEDHPQHAWKMRDDAPQMPTQGLLQRIDAVATTAQEDGNGSTANWIRNELKPWLEANPNEASWRGFAERKFIEYMEEGSDMYNKLVRAIGYLHPLPGEERTRWDDEDLFTRPRTVVRNIRMADHEGEYVYMIDENHGAKVFDTADDAHGYVAAQETGNQTEAVYRGLVKDKNGNDAFIDTRQEIMYEAIQDSTTGKFYLKRYDLDWQKVGGDAYRFVKTDDQAWTDQNKSTQYDSMDMAFDAAKGFDKFKGAPKQWKVVTFGNTEYDPRYDNFATAMGIANGRSGRTISTREDSVSSYRENWGNKLFSRIEKNPQGGIYRTRWEGWKTNYGDRPMGLFNKWLKRFGVNIQNPSYEPYSEEIAGTEYRIVSSAVSPATGVYQKGAKPLGEVQSWYRDVITANAEQADAILTQTPNWEELVNRFNSGEMAPLINLLEEKGMNFGKDKPAIHPALLPERTYSIEKKEGGAWKKIPGMQNLSDEVSARSAVEKMSRRYTFFASPAKGGGYDEKGNPQWSVKRYDTRKEKAEEWVTKDRGLFLGTKEEVSAEAIRLNNEAEQPFIDGLYDIKLEDNPDLVSFLLHESRDKFSIRDTPAVFKKPVSDADLAEFKDLLGGQGEDALVVDGKILGINLDKVNTTEDVKRAITATSIMYEPQIQSRRRGVRSHEMTVRAARALGMKPEDLMNRQTGEAYNAEQIYAAFNIAVASARILRETAARVAASPGNQKELDRFAQALGLHRSIQAQFSGARAETGRSVEIQKLMANGEEGWLKPIGETLLNPAVDPATLAKMIDTLPTVDQISSVVSKLERAKTSDILLEIWINGLLSGPQTHAANLLGNMATILLSPAERLAAGAFRGLTPGQNKGVYSGEAGQMIAGLLSGMHDALSIAAKNWPTKYDEQLQLARMTEGDTSKIDVGYQGAITAEAMGLSGAPGKFVDVIGKFIRTPGSVLATADQFFKLVNYRMELNALAYRMARNEGLSGEAATTRMQEILSGNDADVLEALSQSANKFADIQTFTNDLSSSGDAVLRWANSSPWTRLVLPFIRTPLNIYHYALDRTPVLNMLQKSMWSDLKAGGAVRDLAISKISTSAMVLLAATGMAISGAISGAGPDDKKKLAMLKSKGWQPFSVKIGDTWYAYNRMEPIGAALGTAATFAEIWHDVPEAELATAVLAGALAFSDAMVSKTYLQGLSQVIDAIRQPETSASRVAKSYLGSMVPSILNQANKTMFDQTVREMWTMTDAMRARVPGLSKDLPPKRDIFGHEQYYPAGLGPDFLSPIQTKEEAEYPAMNELLKNEVVVGMPPKWIFGTRPEGMGDSVAMQEGRATQGIEMTPQEYDRYLVKQGQYAESAIHELMREDYYREATPGPDGGKAYYLMDAIRKARRRAQEEMAEDYPRLGTGRERVIQRKIESRTGEKIDFGGR